MTLDPRRPGRRLGALVHALVFLTTVGQVAIVPLLPRFAERFDLTGLQSGWLLASTSVATLVVAVPAGALADRVGARRVTLVAGWLLVGSTLAQAVAPAYGLLLVARLCFGLAYGCVWTTALAWLQEANAGSAADRPLAAATTSAGIALIAGPALAALTAARLGLSAPFLGLAVACGAVTGLLVRSPSPEHATTPGRAEPPVGDALRTAGRRPALRGTLVSIALIGMGTSTVNLVVPLELHAAGVSTQAIGLAFGAAALLYIAVSAGVARLGSAVLSVRAVAALSVGIALAVSPAVASASAAAVLAALALYTLPRAALATVSYPLASADGRAAGLAGGAVFGVLNAAWAAASVAGPLIGGALFQAAGGRLSYSVLAVAALAAAGLVWRDRDAG